MKEECGDFLKQSLASYPTPITTGVVLTVEDYHQDFRCSLHVKHRFGFESILLVPGRSYGVAL